jgi:hypothetical protein
VVEVSHCYTCIEILKKKVTIADLTLREAGILGGMSSRVTGGLLAYVPAGCGHFDTSMFRLRD